MHLCPIYKGTETTSQRQVRKNSKTFCVLLFSQVCWQQEKEGVMLGDML